MPDTDDSQEVDEITPENIKKLAKQAGGGGGDDADEEEEEETPSPSAAGSGGGGGEVNIEVERLKSTIEMLKEQNDSAMDRIQTVSQNMGEIRQMVNEQERSVTGFEADVSKLQDAVEGIEPSTFKKRLGELKARMESNQADIKRVDEKVDRALQIANDVQETLNSLGSMDNLIELNKEFEEKLSEIKEAERYIERLASKSEKINIRINKKMSEYNTYKAMVDTLQEKTSDMFQKLDEVSLDVEDAVTEDQLETMRERIHELEEQVEEYESILPLAEMSLPEPIVELRDQRSDIEDFLEELDEQYSNGKLSTSEYQKIKEANEEKLERINKQLVQQWKNLEKIAEEGPEAVQQAESGGDEEESGSGEGDQGEASGDEGSGDEEDGEEKDNEEYAELLEGSVEDVKKAFSEKNLDADRLLELERAGKDRDTLVSWLSSKAGE